jgi:hypothetical protein
MGRRIKTRGRVNLRGEEKHWGEIKRFDFKLPNPSGV